MYRCQVCKNVTLPGQQRKTHCVTRQVPCAVVELGKTIPGTRSEIASEIPVCNTCFNMLNEGVDIRRLCESMKRGQFSNGKFVAVIKKSKKGKVDNGKVDSRLAHKPKLRARDDNAKKSIDKKSTKD